MKKVNILILAILFAGGLLALKPHKTPGSIASTKITIAVIDEKNKPIANTKVDLEVYSLDTLLITKTTNKNGVFYINLQTGSYIFNVHAKQYSPKTFKLNVSKTHKSFIIKLHKLLKDKTFGSGYRTSSKNKLYEIAGESSSVLSRDDGPSEGKRVIDSRTRLIAKKPRHSKYSSPSEAGKLTAGEVNDFGKWEMWQDSITDMLKPYKEKWNLAMANRKVVQVINNSGYAAVDVPVALVGKNGKVIWESRTDNTGKAEIWESMALQNATSRRNLHLKIGNKSGKINNVLHFSQGVNFYQSNLPCSTPKTVDIAWVVDATGSMGDEIRYLQAEMGNILNNLNKTFPKKNIRTGSVFYRDKNDTYLTKTSDFSEKIGPAIQFINKQKAAGGGDYPEAVAVALNKAINNLSWSKKASARILFLVLDAPPHQTIAIHNQLQHLLKLAAKKGIRIVPLACSGINKSTEYLMRCMALATNGTYLFLTDHSGIGLGHIKPTTDSYEVKKLNALILNVLKRFIKTPDCKQVVTVNNDTTASVSIDKLQYLNMTDTTTNRQNPKDSVKTQPAITWKVYPNPTRGQVQFTTNAKPKWLYISDMRGKLLQRIQVTGRLTTINLSNYAAGIYFVGFRHKGLWKGEKVILQR